MAVTRLSFVSVLIVLVISYKQGAARSTADITKTELDVAEGFRIGTDGNITFRMPAIISRNVIIVINGIINPQHATLTVELPSESGGPSCLIQYDFSKNILNITQAADDTVYALYTDLQITPELSVGPSFILTLHARVDTNEKHLLGVTFNGNGDGESEQLLCKIQKFEDIDKIVIKEGVATVSSLFYKFK
ncbi:hypothetical protein SFRURICE_019263 [Spodoptera frugiperda]|uniref:SFRICE_003874 n=1 Tax=Spodoptera frugiperda TaxID=7108 RepID=A0A2H1VUC6_SPOFR|nr:hypothetical protein SFRURICE_019263 [Spodoptera frugiperda]